MSTTIQGFITSGMRMTARPATPPIETTNDEIVAVKPLSPTWSAADSSDLSDNDGEEEEYSEELAVVDTIPSFLRRYTSGESRDNTTRSSFSSVSFAGMQTSQHTRESNSTSDNKSPLRQRSSAAQHEEARARHSTKSDEDLLEVSERSPAPRRRRFGRPPEGSSKSLRSSESSFISPKRMSSRNNNTKKISPVSNDGSSRKSASKSPVPRRSNNNNRGGVRRRMSLGERSALSYHMSSDHDPLSISERSPIIIRDDASSTGHFSRRTPSIRNRGGDALSVSERLMATSDHESKIKTVMDSLSINKLRYDKVGLVGREEETKILKDCYARLTTTENNNPSQKPQKEMVLVKGYSGVGKSSLVSPLLEMCDQSAKGFCARGNFDFSSVDVPYTAITSAFGQIFENVERRGSLDLSTFDEFGQMQTLGDALTSKLGKDVHLLARMIPKLKKMIPETVPPPSFRKRESAGFDASQKRWEYALRVLTRELNKIYNPLVLFLDDIHWADISSLNLIDCLLSDVENENAFMIVGCYRSNAVEESHILPEKLGQLAKKTRKYGFEIHEIEIDNLDKEGVQNVIMTLLSVDDKEKTEALADICFRRTHGNPFFLIEFMTMLKEESLLIYNLGLLEWSWDDEEVERETMSTENVVDIVHSRMTRLSNSAQLVLQYAACLGTTIRVECLSILLSDFDVDDEERGIAILLHQLERGGFIEQTQSTQYRWVHDNVRESALMLGDASTPLFQFDVGNTLFHHFDDDELDEFLFEVCDLINVGKHSSRVEFARLNLRAAEKARSISAFPSAATYATKGISYLPNDPWAQEYDMTLQLFTLAMEMALATGRVEDTEQYSEEILREANSAAVDKLPVYLAKSHKMTHIDIDHKACTDFLLGILNEEFGIRLFSKKTLLPVKAAASIYSTARAVKKLPNGALSGLKPMERADPNFAAMDLLVRLSTSSYLGKNMFLYLLVTAKMAQLTLKTGVHPMSGYALLTLGTCSMILNGDAEEGANFDKMANELQEIVPDDFAASNTTTISNLFVLPWTLPLNSCRQQLKKSYSISMRAGNTEMAMLSLVSCNITIPLQMGKPLRSIESKCATIAAQCEEMKFGQYAVEIRLNWHMILELMGQSDDSVFVNNKVLRAEGWKPEEFSTEYMDLHNLVYSGDYEAASKLASQIGAGFEKSHPNYHQNMSCTFLRAIALYATASSSSKSKRQANKLRQKMENWAKKGNPNVGHCHHLLCAEKARLDGKYDKATTLYNDAIVLAARTGHIHHAALANERYADFLLHCMKDKEESDYRMQEAIRFYQDWGAHKRVQQLTKQQQC